jgi:hypothetical protein
MKHSPGTGATELPESFRARLNSYALAASAAGVGLLALAQSAEAEIVYTKTHQLIRINTTYNRDLNHDGLTDFVISNRGCITSTINCETPVSDLYATPAAGNGVQGRVLFSGNYDDALHLGARIGPNQMFLGTKALMVFDIESFCSMGTGNFWCNVTNRYLGLRFTIQGETHYGWARISTGANGHRLEALLTGYAYETVPSRPTIAGLTRYPDDAEPDASNTPAPEPLTLGALAMGAPGLSIWRRE